MKLIARLSSLIVIYIHIVASAAPRRLDWHEKKPEEWYQRYDVYPEYCSTPAHMNDRGIPPLDDSVKYGLKSQLKHVTAVIRHGARTPWTNDLQCWENYQTDPSTGSWNCDLTTWLAPPSPKVVEQEEEESYDTSDSGAMFLFEKHYDTLVYPRNNLTNLLNGTCQMGQLLLMGYEQQMTNGKHFRAAYVYNSQNASEGQVDARLQLIDVVNTESTDDDGTYGDGQPWKKQSLRLRADDDQRTIMSGQVLLRGMFEQEIDAYFAAKGEYPVLPLHTADRSRDILGANEKICPRLLQLQQQFKQSETFSSFMGSPESQTLMNFQRDVLKLPDGTKMDAIDCLMTTICTDRTLPDAVNDYKGDNNVSSDTGVARDSGSIRRRLGGGGGGGDDDNMFARLYNWDVKGYVIQQLENSGEFAKLSMSFLWAEMMEVIERVVAEKDDALKFSLVSGHDTTIMLLLMSLGPRVFDGKWTPYASNFVLEIHKLSSDRDVSVFESDFAFRLLYNGKVLTSLMDGCTDDLQLCDVRILIEQVKPFATRNLNCQMDADFQGPDQQHRVFDPTLTTADDVALVVLSALSALVGSLLTYLYMARAAVTKGYTKQRRQFARNGDTAHRDDLSLRVSGDNIDDTEGQFA